MFHELIGTLVWLAANGLYIDLRRKGRGGLARIIFFFMGMPATWLWLFLVPEGRKREELPPARDDYHDLLEEIRRDRALGAGSPGRPDGRPDSDWAERPGRSPERGKNTPERKEDAGHPEDDARG